MSMQDTAAAAQAMRQAAADLGGPCPYVDRELGTILAYWLRGVLRRHEENVYVAHQDWNAAVELANYSARKRLQLSINIDSLRLTRGRTRASRATGAEESYPMSTPYDPNATQAYPASQVPTTGFQSGPAFGQPEPERQQWYQQPAPPAGTAQPDGTPRYTSGNGFTAEERARRARGHGPVYNFFTTGDGKLSLDSEQGKALKPAEYDGFGVTALCLALFVPLAGLILSLISFADAKKNHRRVHGSTIGAFALSALGCIGWTLYWVFVIVAMAALTNAVNGNPYGS